MIKLFITHTAYAQAADPITPIVQWLAGPLGTSLATLAIMVVAATFMYFRQNGLAVITTAFAIFFFFNPTMVLNWFPHGG